MKRVFVIRIAKVAAGCFGVMLDDLGIPFAVTLEKTFDNGEPLLRTGTYRCIQDFYNKGGYATFEVQVSGHDRVLFHKANIETELDGCIAVAESFKNFNNVPGVADSRGGFEEFWSYYRYEPEIELEVVDASESIGF